MKALSVAEWLAAHAVTRCPTGHALGLSAAEKQFGTVAADQRTPRQIMLDEVRAKKRLRHKAKSRT